MLADARDWADADQCVNECLREGGWERVAPEWIGALTDAPIFADAVDYSDEEPRVEPGATVIWFPDYTVRDEWAELRRKGRVTFTVAR